MKRLTFFSVLLTVLSLALFAHATPLNRALLAVATALPAPYAPADKAETAAAERAAFLPTLADGLASAAFEATCSGPWKELECRRRWPGDAAEIASLAMALAFWESRLDARIQGGFCEVWSPTPHGIECDGVLVRSGVRPPGLRGLEKQTKHGLVIFRSSTVFQLQGLSDDRLREDVGLGFANLYEASRDAMRILSSARSTCRGRAWYGVANGSVNQCIVSSFAGTIGFKQAPARVATFEKILREVRVELAKEHDARSGV